MIDTLLKETETIFQGRPFLSVEDVTQLLDCSPSVIANWSKRANPKRRPPRIIIGKNVRFPRIEFIKWLVTEQHSK